MLGRKQNLRHKEESANVIGRHEFAVVDDADFTVIMLVQVLRCRRSR